LKEGRPRPDIGLLATEEDELIIVVVAILTNHNDLWKRGGLKKLRNVLT
jgi:hypothetical protein